MGDLVEISDRKVMKMDNKLIEAKLDLKSSEEMKIFGIVIAQIDKDDEDFKSYEVKIKDLEKLTGKKKNERQLKALANKMLKKTFYIIDEKGWTGYTLFNKIRYIRDEAKLEINFHPDLKPYLLDLKTNFTKINLLNYIHLDSGYAMKIYLLLKQYQTIGKRKFNVDELREILQTPKSYSNFQLFTQKVLNIAQKEINKKTDISISWEVTKRIRRKIVEIEFTITGEINTNEEIKLKETQNQKVNDDIAEKQKKALKSDLSAIDDFKLFRIKILKEYRNKILVLDNQIFNIKGVYLALNDKVLKPYEALDKWTLLFENKEKIEIFNKEEYKKQNQNKKEELAKKIEIIQNKIFYQVVDYGKFKDEFGFKILQINYFIIDEEKIDPIDFQIELVQNKIDITKDIKINVMFEMLEDRSFVFNVKSTINIFYNFNKFILEPDNNKFEWIKE